MRGRLLVKVIISVNDHPDKREVFAGLDIRTTKTIYTVRGNNGHKAGEFLTCNFEAGHQ